MILFCGFASVAEAKTQACKPSGALCSSPRCDCCAKRGVNIGISIMGPPTYSCK